MTYVRVKGFQVFTDRTGRTRCYHRASRTAIDLTLAPLGTSEFFAECKRITDRHQAATSKPGTLGKLIERYRADDEFRDLSDRTRRDYDACFDTLAAISDVPLVRLNKPSAIIAIRDRICDRHGWHRANYVVRVLSIVFAFGNPRDLIDGNPAKGLRAIKRPRHLPRANRPWTDAERAAVMELIPPHMRTAIALMMFCGLDPKDALQLPKPAIKDGVLRYQRSKTGEPVTMMLPAPLVQALQSAPLHDAITLCANSAGKPWTISGFNASWQKVRNRLVTEERIDPGCTLKGLRHTVANVLAELGYDERAIADYLGQKTPEMARHYARGADKRRKLDGVVKSFEEEINRRTDLTNRRAKTVKP